MNPTDQSNQESTSQTIPGSKQPDGAQVSLEKHAPVGTTSSPVPDTAANADAAAHNANAQASQIGTTQVASTHTQVRDDLEKALDAQIDNAISFANKALDILSGDSASVITEEEAKVSGLVLAHVPDYMGLREEANLVIGPLIAKKAGQLLQGVSDSARTAFALAARNLKSRY